MTPWRAWLLRGCARRLTWLGNALRGVARATAWVAKQETRLGERILDLAEDRAQLSLGLPRPARKRRGLQQRKE